MIKKQLRSIARNNDTNKSDIFGKGLMGWYKGDRTPLLIRRDDGRVDKEDVGRYFSDYEKWPEYERKALEYVKGRVLDVGCGAGRHALWLQENGFKIVAIDISPLALEVARLRGVKECKFMDARNLSFPPNSFDTIIMMYNNFGIAGSIEATQCMFKSFHLITKERARAIVTSRDPTLTNDPQHLKYHELNRKRGRPIGQVTIRSEYKDEIGEWFDLLMVTPKEMMEILNPTGWKVKLFIMQPEGEYAAVLEK